MISFTCSQCGSNLRVEDRFAGKAAKCPRCGQRSQVPREPNALRRAPAATPTPLGPGAVARRQAAPSPVTVDHVRQATGAGLDKAEPTTARDQLAERYAFLAPAQLPDEIGHLGGYRVLKVLGAGGMGVVFQAEDTLLARKICLKAILPGLADSDTARQRFLREARAAATLEHDHIVPIFEVGEDRGVPFIAMALLKGEPLEERLRHEPRLPLALVLRLGREVALGLAVAHQHGLVHRDIKPANLWLEEGSDRVKILDFGLARAASDYTPPAQPGVTPTGAVSDNPQLTQVGAIVGTPAYMAPEQALAQAVDSRCDLFSLGCVLYRLCTGVLPFQGEDTMSILMAVAMDTPAPPCQLDPTVPQPLSDLVMQLLAKKPEERPQSAQAVVQALLEIEAQASASMAQPSCAVARPARRPWRRGPALKVGLAFVAVVLVIVAAAIFMKRAGTRPALEAVDSSSVDPRVGDLVVAPARNEAAITTPDISPEPLELEPGAAVRTVSSMALVRQPRPLPGLLSWTIETVANRERVGSFAFRADGRQLATGGLDGTLRIWEPDRDRPLRVLLGHEGREIFVGWSPDGRYLASCADDGTLRFWDPVAGRLLRTLVTPGAGRALAWSPDGRAVASGGWNNYQVRLWDVATGREGRVFPAPAKGSSPRSLAWSPDGMLLAAQFDVGKVVVWDSATGQAVHDWTCDEGVQVNNSGASSLVFAPDGRWLAGAAGGNRAHVWELPSGKKVATLDHRSWVAALGWAPDGQQLISCCYDGYARFWQPGSAKELRSVPIRTGNRGILSPGGKVLASGDGSSNLYFHDLESGSQRTVPGIDFSGRVAWSPRGERLALTHAHGATMIWDAASGRPLRRLDDAGQNSSAVAWSPTSAALAVAAGPKVQLWNPDTSEKRATLEGHTDRVSSVAWSRDGRFLATGGSDKTVRTWEAETGKLLHIFTGHTGPVHAVGWSANGQTLASASADQTVRLWDPATGKPRHALRDHKAAVTSLAWSPDKDLLVSLGVNGTLIWWQPAQGRVLHQVLIGYGPALAWSPNGKALVANTTLVNGLTAEVFTGDASTPQAHLAAELRMARVQPIPGLIWSLAFAPDGKTLLATSSAGVQVLDAVSGRPRGLFLAWQDEGELALHAAGHWRGSPGIEQQLLYIAVTEAGQETLTPTEFCRKYAWKNEPDQVRLLSQ